MKHLFLRFFIALITVMACALTGFPANLDDVSINTQSQFTIIGFEFDSETDIPFKTYTLTNTERIYFDLSNTTKSPKLSNLFVDDERVSQIRLGYKDQSSVRIVFEIANFRASELNTEYKYISDKMYFIIANPDYEIIIDDIINKYILKTEPEEQVAEDPLSSIEDTAEEDSVDDAAQTEDKQEEISQMNEERESLSVPSISFLPESVNEFLFKEIVPGFYTIYAVILVIFLLIVLFLISRRKKSKKKALSNYVDQYTEPEETEGETLFDEKEDYQETEELKVPHPAAPLKDEDTGEDFLFDDSHGDIASPEEDEEIEVAEVLDEESDYIAEDIDETKDTDTDIEEVPLPETSEREIEPEEPDESSKEIEKEIEDSLEVFEKAKTNVNNEMDQEILIKLDEKELSEKTLEESLNESFRYYPLKVGNGWVWRYKNSLRKRMIIGRKELQGKGEVFKIKETVRIGEHKKQTIWYIYKSNKGIIEKADQYKKKILAFPIKINKKWEDDSNNYEIVGMNDTVNNFDKCLKIQVSPKDIPIKRYIYFKKDVGLIMDEAKEELIKYKIDGVEYSI